jgi:ABC-type multidrug transport system fused ATPase/permease subunit
MFNKVWYLLTAEQRISAIVLFGLLFIGMMLETLGIGLVIPAFALITQSNLAEKYPIMSPWLEMLGNPSHERLVVVGMVTLVSVYIIKTLYLAFLAWRQAQFTYDIQANLSQSLFSGYLRQPYTFHLQRNSAQLIRNTISHAQGTTGVIQQCLLLIMEVLVLFGISTMLLVVEPLGAALVLILMGLSGWVFNNFSRKHMLKWGEELQLHEGLRIQHLQQGLGGAKDVKLLGRESDFIDQYDFHNLGSARVSKRQSILLALPRLMLELFAVTGLASLIIVMINQGKPIESLLPITGLFAVAAFRLLPSVNRVISVVQYLRFSLPIINTMYDEIRLLDNTKPTTHSGTLVLKDTLTLEQVRYDYPSTESSALSGINLTITHGTSIGFIGDSGAGKSTLVDIILGLLTPVSGSVKVDGVDIQKSIRGWQDQIGYVPQSIYLTDDTLRKNIAFGLPAKQINDDAVRRAIHDAQLEKFINELSEGLDTVVGERGIRLSGGQRQRIGIARALYHDPSVLVLDEATSSLDTDTESGVMDAVRDLHGKKTILIVAHRLSTVEDCDYLYRLEQGKIIDEGPPESMLYQSASIKKS